MAEPFGSFPDWTFVPGQWTPMGAAPFEFAPNMELEDIDLRFLDAYNVNIPFELTGAAPPPPVAPAETIPSRSPPADPCSAAALATEAFRDSHWRFRPNAQDHGAAEEHNLSLPSGHASPESRVRLDRRATGTRLGVPARDKILTTVVESCRPENTARAVAAFPSVELLDSLLQYSLTSPVARFDSFLHAATFNPNEKRPELLASMASRGAVLTADAALTKLGFAIQECLRIAVPKQVSFRVSSIPLSRSRVGLANEAQWERHNHLIRDLELAQAFHMSLEVGLWSGHGRKVEIAESFLQPNLTMLRRGGKFRRASYPPITLRGDEVGEELEEKWRSWVKQESFKRLIFRVVQHDADSSIALLVNPLISYAEVQLPLPAPEGLWAAATAEEWKAGFLALDAQTLTVADFIDEPEKLQTHRGLVDATAASFAFLSCTWALAWEVVQLSALQRSRPKRWDSMLTTSRREELLKLLGRFRIAMDPCAPCAQDLIMRLELTLLHLHMPFEEIQLFAGMEGPEQARVVYPSVLEWARSEAARSAIWHAGQVLRVARALPRAMLQEHAATSVYHAGLALWVYGLVFDSAAPESGLPSDPSASHDICLDEADSLLLQRFIQFGSGHPCIRGMPETDSQYGEPLNVVHLRHPDMVVETVVGILAASHDGMARPRLVEQLIQLMTGLQRASKRAMEA